MFKPIRKKVHLPHLQNIRRLRKHVMNPIKYMQTWNGHTNNSFIYIQPTLTQIYLPWYNQTDQMDQWWQYLISSFSEVIFAVIFCNYKGRNNLQVGLDWTSLNICHLPVHQLKWGQRSSKIPDFCIRTQSGFKLFILLGIFWLGTKQD